MVNRLQVAIDETIKISQHLRRGTDKELRENLVYSIFDDQLKAHTNFNRQQRHNAKKLLKDALKKQDPE